MAAALACGAIWAASVPPFEGPDELFFYNRARDYAEHPQRREALFYELAAPVVRAFASTTGPASPLYFPGFRFVGNEHGDVNRFVHERPVAPKEHVRTLMALRALVVLLSALTAAAIYGTARLALADGGAALGVTAICLFIPQYSFINAVVHPEAVTRLLAAAVTLVAVARATRRVSRGLSWLLLLVLIALVPLADRQAFFLVPFVLIVVVFSETSWRMRGIVTLAFLLPGIAAAWLIVNYVEEAGTLGLWLTVVRHPIRVLLVADPARGSNPPELAYYVFEYFPKLFMGFWGWLGQPSILLPAWIYGSLAALTAAAAGGLVARGVRSTRGEPSAVDRDVARARVLMAVGIAIMCVPLLYAPALEGRNLWYGRWLFAMVGPILIWLWIGVAGFRAALEREPKRAAAVVSTFAAVAAAWWFTPLSDGFRAGIVQHHYGDTARLLATSRDTVAAAVVMAAAVCVRAWSGVALPRVPAGAATFAFAAACNVALLAGFVRPLYAPMSEADYVADIRKAGTEGDLERAAALYATAVKSYPTSASIRSLADETPRLVAGASLDEMSGLLQDRISKGKGIADRDLLQALARSLPDADWSQSSALRGALETASKRPDLAEPATLVDVMLDGRAGDRQAALDVIRAGHGIALDTPMRKGEVILEGFTVRALPSGATQVTVYFRPEVEWSSRSMWLHAYPSERESYLTLSPVSGRVNPQPHQLAWEIYELPPGRFNVYVGTMIGNDLGQSYPFGMLPS